MVWEANERKRYILLQARSMASFKKRDKKACLRIVKSLYFVGVGGGCIYMYLYMYWQFDPQKWRTNTTSCRGSTEKFFKKRGGGSRRWGDWHEEHEHRRLKPWSGVHVHVRGSGFYRVYILGMFWDDGSTCKLLDFFSRGKGVVAWGLDFHIVKKIVKFVSIFVLIISDVICNYKLLIW